MQSPPQIIQLPLSTFILATVGFTVVYAGSLLLLKFLSTGKPDGGSDMERDWSIPDIDSSADRSSPFHHWDPRIKVASLLVFIFCTASISRFVPACFAVLTALVSVMVARTPLRSSLRRIAAMGGFLGMFLVVMPLTLPAKNGDILIHFQHLPFVVLNLRGFMLALVICLKATAVALMMEPLLGTSPFPVTIQALARLGMPQTVCQMVLLTHRYIFVFHNEMKRMSTGMAVRGFRKKTNLETLRTLGNFIGMLLVHSFDRTQRVYEAMLSRGYRGTLPHTVAFQAIHRDWIMGFFWVALGMALIGMDRLWRALPLPQAFGIL